MKKFVCQTPKKATNNFGCDTFYVFHTLCIDLKYVDLYKCNKIKIDNLTPRSQVSIDGCTMLLMFLPYREVVYGTHTELTIVINLFQSLGF